MHFNVIPQDLRTIGLQRFTQKRQRYLFMILTSTCLSKCLIFVNLYQMKALSNILLTDYSWTQASMAVRWGNLGLRSLMDMASIIFSPC